ncbi:MAG: hypothetical protein M1115_01050 [Actinobacteria bacterium]|nr:hypothetical protein [Actinomycetota bacterium]
MACSKTLRWASGSLLGLAVISGILLILIDADVDLSSHGLHSPISATPLLIAAALLILQALCQRSWSTRIKLYIVAIAFLAWGLYQLFPGFSHSGDLNDLAIVLFVLDVLIMTAGQLGKPRPGVDQEPT